MKVTEYQEIGHYLRDSRESLRISIEQASVDLHIRPRYLKAIEAGALNQLPGKAYTRGYIRNYVSYLRLPSNEVLEAYDALLADKNVEFFVPEPTLKQNLPARQIIWGTVAGILLLYGYWYFAIHDNSALSRISDMPAELSQMVDKKPAATPDTLPSAAWRDCLSAGGVECFVTLPLNPHAEIIRTFYDTIPPAPPQEP